MNYLLEVNYISKDWDWENEGVLTYLSKVCIVQVKLMEIPVLY